MKNKAKTIDEVCNQPEGTFAEFIAERSVDDRISDALEEVILDYTPAEVQCINGFDSDNSTW